MSQRPPDLLHPRVVGFDSSVLVMPSLRRPVRITMLCSDESERSFLVKQGEDIRLDQRIQQLFGSMNDLLRADAKCAERGLCLRTFAVVPVCEGAGLLAWVPDTASLKNIVEVEIARLLGQPERALSQLAGDQLRSRSVNGRVGRGKPNEQTLALMDRVPAGDLDAEFRAWEHAAPSNILRSRLRRSTTGSEAFLRVRGRRRSRQSVSFPPSSPYATACERRRRAWAADSLTWSRTLGRYAAS